MSVDLFVVRLEPPLTKAELERAKGAVNAGHAQVAFHDHLVLFNGISRAALDFATPSPEDLDEGEEPELALPHAVVTSRARAWPWVEWTAFALAKELGARVYDPQDGDFHEGPAEQDLAALLAHQDD